MKNAISTTQMKDAVILAEALGRGLDLLPNEPAWGNGEHLRLPAVIPLETDYEGEGPLAWLVANDFNGYDISTTNPEGDKE